MKEKRKRISLRWSLVALVLGCWVLPLVLLLCLSGYYLNRNMYEKVSQVIASTVENQAGISGVQLEPVSYTHLDVYKRQALPCANRAAQGKMKARKLCGAAGKAPCPAPAKHKRSVHIQHAIRSF